MYVTDSENVSQKDVNYVCACGNWSFCRWYIAINRENIEINGESIK